MIPPFTSREIRSFVKSSKWKNWRIIPPYRPLKIICRKAKFNKWLYIPVTAESTIEEIEKELVAYLAVIQVRGTRKHIGERIKFYDPRPGPMPPFPLPYLKPDVRPVEVYGWDQPLEMDFVTFEWESLGVIFDHYAKEIARSLCNEK